jgi:hypothetical protein
MNEPIELALRVESSGTERVSVVRVGPGQFRLEVTPVWTDKDEDRVHAGDVIATTELPDGTHQFLHVVERAPQRHYSWMVPRFFAESPEYGRFGATVVSAGGNWESALGGVLWAHVPVESVFDPEAELATRIAAAKASAPEA